MMEVAISLAIIGFALVAIIGVLPIGMNVQQQNRQETVIGEDANVLIEDIRNGALGANDLTNYIYAITNNWVEYNPINGNVITFGSNSYTFSASSAITANTYPPGIAIPANAQPLTNGANIIGVLSTPEFMDPGTGKPFPNIYTTPYVSNHIVAYVHSISGPAVNKPPQDNSLMQQDSFGYRIYVVNAGIPVNTNEIIGGSGLTPAEIQLWSSLHDLRLTFLWPQLPNGNIGSGNRTFRASIAGRLVYQPFLFNSPVFYNTNLYVYQSQSFTNSPSLLP